MKTLLEAVGRIEESFQLLMSTKRELKAGIHGQTVGQEAYRLDFAGFKEAEVNDAIINLRQELEKRL